MTQAIGGINEDFGYLIFSPHADLHLKAAVLAINHTEYFFNEIRKSIGDVEFSNFLSLKISDSVLASNKVTCSAPYLSINSKILVLFSFLAFMYKSYYNN